MAEQNLQNPPHLNAGQNKSSYCWIIGGHFKALRNSYQLSLQEAAQIVDLPEEMVEQMEYGDLSYSKETYLTALMLLTASVLTRVEPSNTCAEPQLAAS